MSRLLVLGAGPAGLGAAYRVRKEERASVTVLERGRAVGGNAGSFELAGMPVDFGSHRLHPACDPGILDDIRELLDGDLLDRPRHGRIHLRDRWIHFPPRPLDLLLHLDRAFAVGATGDMVRRALPGHRKPGDSFAEVLESALGPTICRSFYFPYAQKIWGVPPDELSAVQARRRVSANSFGKLIRKVFAGVRGGSGKGRFFYPRGGFGRISEGYARGATRLGAELLKGWTVTELERLSGGRPGWAVRAECEGVSRSFEAERVWSTIPVTVLVRLLRPAPPADVLEAARALRLRSMILVYIELGVDRFTPFDAHYFPSSGIRITRLSEPKNYAAATEPRGRTILCAELPCSSDEDVWTADGPSLGEVVAEDLRKAGIPLPVAPTSVEVRRLPSAYPIYRRGFEEAFESVDRWVGKQEGLLSFGRQGLFAHDNTHHALAMAYAAADCLRGDDFDEDAWARHRRDFEHHVVED